MRTNLENYIKMNRDQFDTLSPSDALWSKIDVSLPKTVTVASKIAWLKYFGFGASVVAVVVYLKVNSSNHQTVVADVKKQEMTVSPIAINEKSDAAVAKQTPVSVSPKAAINTPLVLTQGTQRNQTVIETAVEVGYKNNDNSSSDEISAQETNNEENSQSDGASVVTQAYTNGSEKDENAFVVDTLFTGVKTLEINCSSLDVDIKTHASNQVTFKANVITETKGMVKGKNTYKTVYQRKDSTLIINVVSEGRLVVMGTCNVKNPTLNFVVPVATNVVVSDSYGDVTANGLQGATCKLQAKSGDMKVENIQSNTEIIATYGDVTITNIKGDLTAVVTSGDLSITDVEGNVNAKSTYGDQKFKGIVGNIKTANTSGDVKIKNLKGNIDMACIYGSVRLEDCIGNLSIDAVSGDISGKNVELIESMSTTSKYGSVDVQLVNELSSLSFDLKTTYGEISIDKNGQQLSGDNTLVINKGKIMVKGVTSSGDQSYK